MSTTKKPSQEEDEYFAKEDALRRHKLAVEKARLTAAAEQERLKQLHFMKCPKCGFDLETIQYKGLAIDKCFHCNGTWLDAGELESLAGKETHVLQSIISLFKRGQ
ncbi:MAG TPA: zf-TFIIB domain-containing protein [Polyangia bacterium]|nr:zf-TFIIB domain-containing protein [Polyangia bacterium]